MPLPPKPSDVVSARELGSGAGSLSRSDAAVLAAERGEEEVVLAWLEGGGWVRGWRR